MSHAPPPPLTPEPEGPEPMYILRDLTELRARLHVWRKAGRRLALVPTMGALHEGHLSLIDIARRHADVVAATIFVNPKQFAPNEDLAAYPRTERQDIWLLMDRGCNLLYAPPPEQVYPPGFATAVAVSGVGEGLESEARPHFFTGVATVVAKLLALFRPDVAVFGEKDYQQLLVIRRLAADLDLGVEILSGPTQREEDGLAMSSRNARLSPQARAVAGWLNVVLKAAAARCEAGEPLWVIETDTRNALLEAGFEAVDYVALRDAETLGSVGERLARPARLLAAARVGGVRLIDNLPVAAPPEGG